MQMSFLPDQHENLFRKTFRFSMAFYLLAAALVTVIRLPLPEQPDVRDLPDRVAKLILEPPTITPPPVPEKVSKGQEEKLKEKPAKKAVPPKPSVQQTREIVRKSGLLASLIEEEEKGNLNTLIENKRLDQALSGTDLITTSSTKTSRPSVKKDLSHDTGLADKKIARIGTLNEGDRVKLAKGEQVTLTPLKRGASSNSSGGSGEGSENGVGIRLKGRGSSSVSIDYDAIARVVEKYKTGLIYLYNKELRVNPTLKGTITVEFSIDSSGKVIEVHVASSTMDHAPLEKALAGRIKMWKFPHLYDGIIVVTYPFVFFPV
jgi:TonB family protein